MFSTYDVREAFVNAFRQTNEYNYGNDDLNVPDSGTVEIDGEDVTFTVVEREGFNYDYDSMGYGGLQAHIVVALDGDEFYSLEGRTYSHTIGFELDDVSMVKPKQVTVTRFERV